MTSREGTTVRGKTATAYHFILFYCTWPLYWNALMLVRCVYDMQRSPFLCSISLQCGDWYLLYLNNNLKAVKVLVFRFRNDSVFFLFMTQCPLVIVIFQPRNRGSLCVHWKKCKIVYVQQLNTSLHTNGLHFAAASEMQMGAVNWKREMHIFSHKAIQPIMWYFRTIVPDLQRNQGESDSMFTLWRLKPVQRFVLLEVRSRNVSVRIQTSVLLGMSWELNKYRNNKEWA